VYDSIAVIFFAKNKSCLLFFLTLTWLGRGASAALATPWLRLYV